MTTRASVFLTLFLIIVLGLAAYGGWQYYTLHQSYVATQASLASTTAELQAEQDANQNLTQTITTTQNVNTGLIAQLGGVTSSVVTLTKLSQTDPQLLAKYSKVYFLNENYTPASLTDIDSGYLYDPTRTLQFDTQAYPFLKKLMDSARSSGVDLSLASAYRSFSTQATLKSEYKVTYGTGANAFSADQGYSEHQLGTAVDFTTKSLAGALDGFSHTDAYTWLVANAYQYGFILSYPPNNAYYEYEPWHWRFVGIDLATYLHNQNEHFYDLDQRTIDGYLVSLFDTTANGTATTPATLTTSS